MNSNIPRRPGNFNRFQAYFSFFPAFFRLSRLFFPASILYLITGASSHPRRPTATTTPPTMLQYVPKKIVIPTPGSGGKTVLTLIGKKSEQS